MTNENSLADEERFLTRKELARLLQVRPERIRQWERRGPIPRIAPPGTRLVLYPRSAVLGWLTRIRANEESAQRDTARPDKELGHDVR